MENFKAADVEFQARFRHENIAELYGALFYDQSVHLFMEAGEGGSVLEKLDSCGPMREFEIIWVTKQVLRGLEYLHSHNVIHHDIKRKNKRMKALSLVDACTALYKASTNSSGNYVISGFLFFLLPLRQSQATDGYSSCE